MTPSAATQLFRAERARFAAAFPHVRNARLVIVRRPCLAARCSARDVADANLETLVVRLVERALSLPVANLRGVFRHELGHLCDPLPDYSGGEARADAVAKIVTGKAIHYDHNALQTTGRGGPRPKGLHQ